LFRLTFVAQVRDQIRDVRKLLLEVSLVRLETFQQLLPVRERPAEVEPAAAVSVVMTVHCHLLSA
jgi:hypothetical protein